MIKKMIYNQPVSSLTFRKFWLIIVAGFVFQILPAQDTLQLRLSDAILTGLENNYQIRISAQGVKKAQNNNSPGAAGRYPSLNFSAIQGNSFDNSESRTVPDTRDKLTTNFISPAVTLNWTVFDGFRINITKKNLEALEDLSEGYAAVIVENTIQGIILAYYNILLQTEILNVLEEVKGLS
nr:TolC family protein [Bacteroidota bacterium]